MSTRTFADANEVAQHAARHIADLLTQKPDATLCLASGETPIPTFRALVELAQTGHANLNECTFVGLDEWVGFGPTDEGSCGYYLYRDLFDPLRLRPEQIRYFDAKASDLDRECRKIDQFLTERGGLDLLLVGIGMNGHIALNEPGTPFTNRCHVVELAEMTKTVGQKYFTQPTELSHGITLGLQHLTEAREVILMATGERKRDVIQQAFEGPVTEAFPASIIQQHPNAHVWVDFAV